MLCNAEQQKENHRYLVNGKVVSDTITKLMWQRCSFGLEGEDCMQGQAIMMPHNKASKLTSDLAEYKDWRLPTIKELATLIDYSCIAPSINTQAFPNTANEIYWSSDFYSNSQLLAWGANFYNGVIFYSLRFRDRHLRLVRDDIPLKE